jgi:hypothetical protein
MKCEEEEKEDKKKGFTMVAQNIPAVLSLGQKSPFLVGWYEVPSRLSSLFGD